MKMMFDLKGYLFVSAWSPPGGSVKNTVISAAWIAAVHGGANGPDISKLASLETKHV